MKRYISNLSSHKNQIYKSFEDAKPQIEKYAKNLEIKLELLDAQYEKSKQDAYDKYIDSCNILADNAFIKLKMQYKDIDESCRDYLYQLLVDYADIN